PVRGGAPRGRSSDVPAGRVICGSLSDSAGEERSYASRLSRLVNVLELEVLCRPTQAGPVRGTLRPHHRRGELEAHVRRSLGRTDVPDPVPCEVPVRPIRVEVELGLVRDAVRELTDQVGGKRYRVTQRAADVFAVREEVLLVQQVGLCRGAGVLVGRADA